MTVANIQSQTAGLAPDSDQVISGIAIGVGDVTRGLSGDRKVWTADELRAAAATLEGTPINPLHSQQEVGEVVRAGFDADRGVIYEAELEDESLADQAAKGQLEVSIEARHADGGTVETDSGEAMLATNIEFTGLSLVQHGAAPSASASPGEAAALSPGDITAALESDDPASTEGDAEDIEIDDSTETALENKVDEHNDEAADGTDDAVSPETGQAEAGGERTDTKTTTDTQHMSETEEELRSRLSEKDDRIAKLESEVEQLEEEREDVALAYAEALAAGDTVVDEDELVEKFEVAELREKYEATEDATLAETEPTVQSGDSDTETATLSDAEQEEVAEHRDVIADLADSEKIIAQKERERRAALVADKTGEDPETILADD